MREFPSEGEAPAELQDLPSNCGPVAVWQVLRSHSIDATPSELLEALRFDPTEGTFMIAIAVALSAFGLVVALHTDPDPSPTPSRNHFTSSPSELAFPFARPFRLRLSAIA